MEKLAKTIKLTRSGAKVHVRKLTEPCYFVGLLCANILPEENRPSGYRTAQTQARATQVKSGHKVTFESTDQYRVAI